MRSNIIDLHQQLTNKRLRVAKLIKRTAKRMRKFKKTNFLVTDNFVEAMRLAKYWDQEQNFANSFLSCVPYVLKDNVSTKNIVTTGGSRFLENYVPAFDATVYRLLSENNAILMGKANLDEFGLGGTGSFSAYGVVANPYNPDHIAGGSSSGSAVAVAANVVPFAIGTDTGDSIRRPASFCGVVGYKPTYGLVSRYGVFPYAPSLDHVGVFANTVADAAIAADAIVAYDPNDFSSQRFDKNLFIALGEPLGPITLGYPEALEKTMAENVLTAWNKLKSLLLSSGIALIPLRTDMELLAAIDPVYKIISYSEAVSCYSSFSGVPFGKHLAGDSFEAIAGSARTALFGDQLKYRFTIGSFALKKENFEKYFVKSKLVRAKLVRHFERDLLAPADAILTVAASGTAPLISDVLANKPTSNVIDDFLQLANFAGAPSITLPFAKNEKNLFLGLNLTCPQFCDDKLMRIALRQILLHNDISDAKMESGSMRADINLSIRPAGSDVLGTRIEIKNVNSISNVEKAVRYEVARQIRSLLLGVRVEQTTMRYDDAANRTEFMREKTNEVDYRYMREPNIIQIRLSDEWVAETYARQPIVYPEEIAQTLRDSGVEEQKIALLLDDVGLLGMFQRVAARTKNHKETSRWLLVELAGILNESGHSFARDVSDQDLDNVAELIGLLDAQKINGKQAKTILGHSYRGKKRPSDLIAELGMEQITDRAALEAMLREIIAANQAKIKKDYATRADRVESMVLGLLMKKTNGQANPAIASEIAKTLLAQNDAA